MEEKAVVGARGSEEGGQGGLEMHADQFRSMSLSALVRHAQRAA